MKQTKRKMRLPHKATTSLLSTSGNLNGGCDCNNVVRDKILRHVLSEQSMPIGIVVTVPAREKMQRFSETFRFGQQALRAREQRNVVRLAKRCQDLFRVKK